MAVQIVLDDGIIEIDEDMLMTIPYFKALRISGMRDQDNNKFIIENNCKTMQYYLNFKVTGEHRITSYQTLIDVALLSLRLGDDVHEYFELFLNSEMSDGTFLMAIEYARQVPSFISCCVQHISHSWTNDLTLIVDKFPIEMIIAIKDSEDIENDSKIKILFYWYANHTDTNIITSFLTSFDYSLLDMSENQCIINLCSVIANDISACVHNKIIHDNAVYFISSQFNVNNSRDNTGFIRSIVNVNDVDISKVVWHREDKARKEYRLQYDNNALIINIPQQKVISCYIQQTKTGFIVISPECAILSKIIDNFVQHIRLTEKKLQPPTSVRSVSYQIKTPICYDKLIRCGFYPKTGKIFASQTLEPIYNLNIRNVIFNEIMLGFRAVITNKKKISLIATIFTATYSP